ncbi:MAG: hypothetical protein AB2556_06310 [Candidatus Thiodiazotropha sp.]
MKKSKVVIYELLLIICGVVRGSGFVAAASQQEGSHAKGKK